MLIPGCGGGDGGSHSYTSSNSAILTWNSPTTNADSTTPSEVSGYKIYYGTSAGNYSVVIDAGNVTEYKIDDLSPGTYYFAVTAYNRWGYESDYSNEVSKTIY